MDFVFKCKRTMPHWFWLQSLSPQRLRGQQIGSWVLADFKACSLAKKSHGDSRSAAAFNPWQGTCHLLRLPFSVCVLSIQLHFFLYMEHTWFPVNPEGVSHLILFHLRREHNFVPSPPPPKSKTFKFYQKLKKKNKSFCSPAEEEKVCFFLVVLVLEIINT